MYKGNRKEAQAQARKVYYQKNREKELADSNKYYRTHKVEEKNSRMKRLYGIDLNKWDEIWIEQIGLCPICGNPLPKGYKAYIDHDHKTGKVRGLLHLRCNTFLGEYENKKDNINNYLGGN